MLHSTDAAARAVRTGQRVRVFNDLGEVTLVARVTADLMAGTVVAPGVWWAKFSEDHRNINQLVPQGEADMGSGALFYDVRVQVEIAGPEAQERRK